MRGQKGVEFYQESTVIANERLKILIFLLFDLKTSGRGQNGVEFNQESTGHALLLANERLNFAWNPIIVVPDMCQISFSPLESGVLPMAMAIYLSIAFQQLILEIKL